MLLDVAGQDATEAFEDVGHSDEARETLAQLQVGTLKRKVGHPPSPSADALRSANASPAQPGDPAPKAPMPSGLTAADQQSSGGLGVGLYAVVILGGLIAYGAYTYMQQQQVQKS